MALSTKTFLQDGRIGLSEFFQSIGHRIVGTPGHFWYDIGPRVFFPLPFHMPVSLSPEDMETLWNNGALVLRYLTSAIDRGYPSYIFLVSDKYYSLSNLKGKNRNQTRRGLENCRIQSIPFASLAREGLDLVADTLDRQQREFTVKTKHYWRDFFMLGSRCSALEAWGAFVGGDLAAFLIALTYGGCSHIHMVFSRRDLLKFYPINAITFSFTHDAIRRNDVSHVSYGIRSIRGDSETLNKFKAGMGFARLPVSERIEVIPWFRGLLNVGVARALSALAEKYGSRSESLKNLQGLLHTYLNQDKT